MTKSTAPFFTIAPSVKCTECRYPLTRARISTDPTASSRPVYVADSTTWRTTGWLTVTCGGGGGGVAASCCWQAVSRNTNPIRGSRHTRFITILLAADAAHDSVRRPLAWTRAPGTAIVAAETLGRPA